MPAACSWDRCSRLGLRRTRTTSAEAQARAGTVSRSSATCAIHFGGVCTPSRPAQRSHPGLNQNTAGGPPRALGVNLQLADESLGKTRLPAPFRVETDPLGAARVQRRGECPGVGFPLAEGRIAPAVEPGQAVLHVADLVPVDALHQPRRLLVPQLAVHRGVVRGVVEVGLLQGEAEAGDELRSGSPPARCSARRSR